MQESGVLQMSIKPLRSVVFFTFQRGEAALFSLPLAVTVIHVNRASSPGGFIPYVPGQPVETSCLMLTLSVLWEAGEARGREGRMSLSCGPLSHTAVGLLALSPPALASAVDERRCLSGRPHVSIGCSLLLTAPDRPAARPLCPPEHTGLLFL